MAKVNSKLRANRFAAAQRRRAAGACRAPSQSDTFSFALPRMRHNSTALRRMRARAASPRGV
jgi:hypothetical protein